MKYIKAFLYWIYPQQGAIDALKRQVKAQEALIQTLRCRVKSAEIENDKLWRTIGEFK